MTCRSNSRRGVTLPVSMAPRNVTVLVTMIGGSATNTVGALSTAEDWTRYGPIQQDDPEMQAVMVEAGQIAIRETYVSQTIRTCNG